MTNGKLKAYTAIFMLALYPAIGGYMKVSGEIDGFDRGLKQSDQEAFDSYVNFNRKFQKEVKKIKREQKHHNQKPVNTASSKSVWDVVE